MLMLLSLVWGGIAKRLLKVFEAQLVQFAWRRRGFAVWLLCLLQVTYQSWLFKLGSCDFSFFVGQTKQFYSMFFTLL